jgi:hypothetical protein
MGAEYWAGLWTGLGWGVTAGLGVALAVALWPERREQPDTTRPPREGNVKRWPNFGENDQMRERA